MKTAAPTDELSDLGLNRSLRILHIEDDPNDRDLVQQWIKDQCCAVEFTDVDNHDGFHRAFNDRQFDIVLSDNSLPDFDGMTALRFVRGNYPHIPFVFVTGSMGEEAAIETIKHGATDYVLKDRLSRLIPAVRRAIREAAQAAKNRQIEEKNREQAALLDKAQDAILVTDIKDRILYWNKSAERIYGWASAEVIGREAAEFLSRDPVKYEEARQALLKKGSWTGELVAANRGGNELIIEGRWTLMRDEAGQPGSILIIDTDITEKKAIEARFLRSQRLDSLGALAAGIAHDLNNALAPVIMCAEMLRDCEEKAERTNFLQIVTTNAQRATGLVKQILSFARGSSGQAAPLQIKHLVSEMGKMIQDTFPKSISLAVKLPTRPLWTVQGDATELHQIFLNLCVNARDAMPEGGKLTLSAANVTLDEFSATALGGKAGTYVVVSVADTGTGIPPEVLPRIFEPFFTTKKADKGTGLGLATVSTIIKHHGGFMDIHTEIGKGTEFKIYFPATNSTESDTAHFKEVTLPTGNNELIMVIDDEETVRELTKTMLESYGYRVITAQNGLQGIARFREKQDEIKLIITDADMPHLDGAGTVRAIRELQPGIPVIVASGASGHAQQLLQSKGVRPPKSLEKPFGLTDLLLAVDAELKGEQSN